MVQILADSALNRSLSPATGGWAVIFRRPITIVYLETSSVRLVPVTATQHWQRGPHRPAKMAPSPAAANMLRKSYALATLHRPANVDDPAQLGRFLKMMTEIAKRIPVVFPVHPRTRQNIAHASLPTEGLILTPPLGYLDFLRLMTDARFVLTDSGGIQEETTVLHVPCLTLRDNTERPVTIEVGTNRLVGTDADNALRAALELLEEPPRRHARRSFGMDTRASESSRF